MRTWPEVERALQARPGWRRVGNEWHGPCPVTGSGTDCAWFGPGSGSGGVRSGCRHCGDGSGRLDDADWREHLAAVCGDGSGRPFPGPRSPAVSGRHILANLTRSGSPCGDFSPSPDRNHVPDSEALSEAVWRAATPADRTPGWVYLVRRRRVRPADMALPASVRWLPADRTRALRPRLPRGAAGVLLYRFAAVGESVTAALQCEAVTADGERLAFGGGGKRVSLAGSDFSGGARVFVAREAHVFLVRKHVLDALRRRDIAKLRSIIAAQPGVGPELRRLVADIRRRKANLARGDGGCHVCEGPLDALALVALERLGVVRLDGAAVVGVAGTAGFKPAACIGSGPVTLWPDPDPTGERAAGKLIGALTGSGRGVSVRWRTAAPGRDLADWAAEAALEREAIRG